MADGLYMPMEVFNAILLALVTLVPVGILIAITRPSWGEHLAYRASVRAHLPISSERMAQVLAARTRKIVRSHMWALLVAIVIVASMFLLVPLGVDSDLIWALALTGLLATMAGSEVALTLREHVFTPAPAEPRVARADTLTVREYLDPVRRFIPAFLLASTVVVWIAVAVVAIPQRFAPSAIVLLMIATAVAVAGLGAGRWAEARVIDQSQPASTALELAWDDLFRADSLGTLRMAQSVLLWIPVGMGLSVILDENVSVHPALAATAALLPWIGIPAIQIAYSLASGRLPARLQPDPYDAVMPGEGQLT